MNKLLKNSQIIAFDYGAINIGVAIGQFTTCTATPLKSIKSVNNSVNWRSIADVIEHWQPSAAVVGLPYNMDDSQSEMVIKSRRFGNRINGRFNLDVFFIDERLTTCEAKIMAKNSGHKGNYAKKPIDSIAAVLILESWLVANKDQIK